LLATIILLSFSADLHAQNQQKGGFIYGWNNYDNSDFLGLGQKAAPWDSTGLATINHAPAAGIHPRIFFGPEEVPAISTRLTNTVSGQSISEVINAYTILLHVGYSNYNQNAAYAQDGYGTRLIDNSGAWDRSVTYAGLVAEDHCSFSQSKVMFYTTKIRINLFLSI